MKSISILAFAATFALADNLCDQFAHTESNGYYANNNKWGDNLGTGTQCLSVDKMTTDGVSWSVDWTWSGNDDMTKAYPYAGRTLEEKKLVSAISNIPSQADWGYTGDAVRANVAYDMFTSSDPAHDTSSGEYEVMVWLGNDAKLWPVGTAGDVVKVAGKEWTLWDGMNGDMHVYSFVATEDQNSVDFDVKEFFDHLRDNKDYPVDSQYLTTLQLGTEPMTGGPAQFLVNWFSAEVN
jgi:xyloglucan-specific endo-beta-1,4-glucanase